MSLSFKNLFPKMGASSPIQAPGAGTEECSICTENYQTSASEQWKIFDRCSHKVCKDCFSRLPRQIWNLTNEPKRNVKYKIPRIKCPFCRSLHTCKNEINDPNLNEVEAVDLPPLPIDELVIFMESKVLEMEYDPNDHDLWFTYTADENGDNVTITEDGPWDDGDEDGYDLESQISFSEIFGSSSSESDWEHVIGPLIENQENGEDTFSLPSSDDDSEIETLGFSRDASLSDGERMRNFLNELDNSNHYVDSEPDNRSDSSEDEDLGNLVNHAIQEAVSFNDIDFQLNEDDADESSGDEEHEDYSHAHSDLLFNSCYDFEVENSDQEGETDHEEGEQPEQGNYEDETESEHDNVEEDEFFCFDSDDDAAEPSGVVSEIDLTLENHEGDEDDEEEEEINFNFDFSANVEVDTDTEDESDFSSFSSDSDSEGEAPPPKRSRRV